MTVTLAEIQQAVAERALDNERRWFGADVCDLIGPVFTDGGSGGDSSTLKTVASGIEVSIKELSGADAQTTIGGVSYVSSHSLEMKRLPATLAVTPQYKIKVRPRNGVPELVFETPVSPAESFTPILVFKASFVRQGSQ